MEKTFWLMRAWLSFTILQSLGTLFFAVNDAGALSSRLFVTSSAAALRQHALTIGFLLCIRISLLFIPSSLPLQRLHIILSSVSSMFTISEIYLMKAMTAVYANFFGAGISALSALFSALYLCHTVSNEVEEQQRRPKRVGGRLFAKHYMENDLLDMPDTPEIRELRKRL